MNCTARYAGCTCFRSVKQCSFHDGCALREESVDAVVLLDGGSDSLMKGDEHGVGDLTEDMVRVAFVTTTHVMCFSFVQNAFIFC
jgi:hypothetical protein